MNYKPVFIKIKYSINFKDIDTHVKRFKYKRTDHFSKT